MGHDMRMDRLKIAHRIFTGQGLLLFLLLLIGGGAFVGLTIIDSSFSDYRRIARNSNLIAAVDQNVSQTRIQMKDFLLSGDEVFVPRIQEATKEVDALLAEAEKALINPSRRAMLAELTATFATYKTTISDVVSLDAKIDKVSADILDKNAPMALGKLDQALRLADSDGDARTAMLIANTERDFLLVRFYMQRFENLRDEATQGALTKALADLERSTKALVDQSRGARRTLVGEIVQHLTDYREGATTKMNLLHETETIVQARLNPSGGKLSKLTQDIAESQTGQQNQIGPQVVATINTIEASAIGLSILSVLLGIGGSMIVARSITQPVNSLTATMGRLADGDLSVDVGFTDNRDEIGDMSRALEVFKTNGIERRRLEEEQAAAREARERRAQALETLMGRFDQDVQALVGELGSASTQMRASAQSMSALSEQTAQQSMSVASAAEQASANVQAVATATEELSSSLGEITRRVAESAQITRVAYDQANETNRTVNSLSEAAGRIGTVVQLIADIAGQTNLLALNATIEAARAGEAGKGFAVVASEVKSLATQTARATGDISEQVQQVQSATQQAVDAIRSITGTIARVNEIAAAIAAAVEEQGAATQEIARNVQQAAAGTQDVTSTIDSVRGAADETGQSAGEVLNAAVSLQSQSTRLTQVVGSFLTGVKAA
ncbi:methyl-accepting chemotaxis protein [Asticcacaulis sp.]|uniref:HAMP domain-containing methyl-accepting chemotaxis protein n=1 Tax=Asticcacaulis sp. TaxID=1872648 RepID=UPI002626C431|nr:methyl-accepting chemotaxis protein [Asticcacaulis sp.]